MEEMGDKDRIQKLNILQNKSHGLGMSALVSPGKYTECWTEFLH
jgi:hypothetical protein